ncbi:MAG: hypothetical protein IJT94_05875 [Oscillibacter sp.]|nr:hypothetical protein [Oscillibacter sp.]
MVDRNGMRTTTYQELYDAARKVNGWLRSHGIGREDVCAIYLPKGGNVKMRKARQNFTRPFGMSEGGGREANAG